MRGVSDFWGALQDKGAVKAAAMPEFKRWLDPAIIERNWVLKEAERAAEEKRRQDAIVEGKKRLVSALNKQLAERAVQNASKEEADSAYSKAYLASAATGEAHSAEEGRRRLQLKLKVGLLLGHLCSFPSAVAALLFLQDGLLTVTTCQGQMARLAALW
jgi:hypothetical protein